MTAGAVPDPRHTPLPTGDVTFLLTDIEGSTALFTSVGEDRYRQLLAVHHRIVRDALAAHGGAEIVTEGDAFLAAFASSAAAVRAALDAQRVLEDFPWPSDGRVRVRMGLHRGEAYLGEARDYISLTLHQAARVAATPHGGQVVATRGVDVPSGVVGTDLGSYWLKDFAQPLPLVLLTPTGTDPDRRPPRAPRADLTNVTGVRGELVGRHEPTAELVRALEVPGLVTVVGPGGVGKTRLAHGVASAAAAAGGEVWFVELASLSGEDDDGHAVTASIARAVGAQAPTLPALVRQVAASSMLLVLDNAEHVLGDVCDVVGALLAGCPAVRVLVTSREALTLGGEVVMRLPPLATPERDCVLDATLASPAVALFTQRARSAGRPFTVDEGNHAEVGELVRVLDGMPLALELAAARVGSLGPAALVQRLRAVGDLPGLAMRGRAGRHSALGAVLDWSLTLCTPTEVAVLRRLAVFAAAVDVDAVVEVAGGDGLDYVEVVDALAGLVEKSLVVLREGPVLGYDLLVTVRAAALARLLESGERDEAKERHARWVVRRLAVAAPGGVEAAIPAILALAPELELALERGADAGIPVTTYAAAFAANRRHLVVRQPTLGVRHGRALADLSPDPTTRAFALTVAASAMDLLRLPEQQPTAREAVTVARETGRPDLLALALGALGYGGGQALPEGSPQSLAIDEAVSLLPQLDAAPQIQGVILCSQAVRALDRGDTVEARRCYLLAQAKATEARDDYNLAVLTYNLAEADELEGDTAAARTGYADAARRFADLGALTTGALTLTQLSAVALAAHDARDAVEIATEAVLVARRARAQRPLLGALAALEAAATLAGDELRAGTAAQERERLVA